jgi:hypothetical protein
MNSVMPRLRARAHTALVLCHEIPPIREFAPNIPMAVWVPGEEEGRLASMDAGGVDILPGVRVEDLTWDLLAALPPVHVVATWGQFQAVEVAVE